jgi:hypothetical protein
VLDFLAFAISLAKTSQEAAHSILDALLRFDQSNTTCPAPHTETTQATVQATVLLV